MRPQTGAVMVVHGKLAGGLSAHGIGLSVRQRGLIRLSCEFDSACARMRMPVGGCRPTDC